MGKLEAHCAGEHYDRAGLFDDHPLLTDYREPTSSLFISSRAADPDATLSRLAQLTHAFFDGWRPLERYLNADYPPLILLAEGYGMLLKGPASYVAACATALARDDVRVDPIVPGVTRDRPLAALCFGRSYVTVHFPTQLLRVDAASLRSGPGVGQELV
ncbi:MAG: hypothetical protein HOW73_29415, partial [Polyangiaceae bacterium]|nr:hypothetical protein [Polyangiaceae bacterium]